MLDLDQSSAGRAARQYCHIERRFSGMTSTLFITAIIAVFCTFGVAMAYAQFATRGIVAPGGRQPE
jgi:amino acid transporter